VAYAIEITRPALRQMKKLDPRIRERLSRRIDQLAEEPLPPGAVQLKATSPPLYRVREGDYRIVYRIEQERLTVLVVRIGHRSEVYRQRR
jgi:mRNA interferase RelE/StbE